MDAVWVVAPNALRSPSEAVTRSAQLHVRAGGTTSWTSPAAQSPADRDSAPHSDDVLGQLVKQEAGPATKSPFALELVASRASRVGGLRAQAGT
jgi:hypothetical protein